MFKCVQIEENIQKQKKRIDTNLFLLTSKLNAWDKNQDKNKITKTDLRNWSTGKWDAN